MDIAEYITGKMLYLVPVLYILGAFLKNTPKMPDWLIPWALTLIGVISGFAIMGIGIEGGLQGILAAGAAVLGNQLLKQTLRSMDKQKDC